jgi:hypothetical protein
MKKCTFAFLCLLDYHHSNAHSDFISSDAVALCNTLFKFLSVQTNNNFAMVFQCTRVSLITKFLCILKTQQYQHFFNFPHDFS